MLSNITFFFKYLAIFVPTKFLYMSKGYFSLTYGLCR